AFTDEVISEGLTPTLYRLATKGINFNNYYQPVWGGSTSTGEYSNMTGLIPAYGVASMKMTIYNNNYYTIGNHLMRQSYFSRAYHAHVGSYYDRNLTHENLGYEKFIAKGSELDITTQWPESDLEMMEATVDDYIDHQPFSIYYMTVSGHTNYNWAGNAMSGKNRGAVDDLDRPTPVKAYLAANLEFEYAMEYLVNRLEEAGIADDTVIVIGNDHYPFGLEQERSDNFKNALGDLYGYDYVTPWERDHNRLIIWSGCLEDMDPIVVDDPVYSLDIVPTLLNLLGLPFDSRLYVGRDVFSDQMPLVIWSNYNWMTDKACFTGGQGVKAFEGFEDEVTDEYIKMVSSTVANKFVFSKAVLDYNYYNILFDSE
ncbi:MAG: LTA synthase family protein, partial [Lachnospiraceae bacterium]|nr:LTA synthase family protein [Lachnospiraceae bacterium]